MDHNHGRDAMDMIITEGKKLCLCIVLYGSRMGIFTSK